MARLKMKEEDEMLEEYDFSNGVRGKYVSQYNDGINIIKLDKDVRKYFQMLNLLIMH